MDVDEITMNFTKPSTDDQSQILYILKAFHLKPIPLCQSYPSTVLGCKKDNKLWLTWTEKEVVIKDQWVHGKHVVSMERKMVEHSQASIQNNQSCLWQSYHLTHNARVAWTWCFLYQLLIFPQIFESIP